MATITLREAQATLPELIHRLAQGEAPEITENGQPIAVVTASAGAAVPGSERAARMLGTQAGTVLFMNEYME